LQRKSLIEECTETLARGSVEFAFACWSGTIEDALTHAFAAKLRANTAMIIVNCGGSGIARMRLLELPLGLEGFGVENCRLLRHDAVWLGGRDHQKCVHA